MIVPQNIRALLISGISRSLLSGTVCKKCDGLGGTCTQEVRHSRACRSAHGLLVLTYWLADIFASQRRQK